MTQDMKHLMDNPGALGINGWTDYQLLRLLRCYDTWSASPFQCREIDRAATKPE